MSSMITPFVRLCPLRTLTSFIAHLPPNQTSMCLNFNRRGIYVQIVDNNGVGVTDIRIPCHEFTVYDIPLGQVHLRLTSHEIGCLKIHSHGDERVVVIVTDQTIRIGDQLILTQTHKTGAPQVLVSTWLYLDQPPNVTMMVPTSLMLNFLLKMEKVTPNLHFSATPESFHIQTYSYGPHVWLALPRLNPYLTLNRPLFRVCIPVNILLHAFKMGIDAITASLNFYEDGTLRITFYTSCLAWVDIYVKGHRGCC